MNKKITLFGYSKIRKTECVLKILNEYNEVITIDGYSGYDAICEKRLVKQSYLVHTTREFSKKAKTLNKNQLKLSVFNKIVKKFDNIFKKEASFKKNILSPEEIVTERNKDGYLKIN